jgi:hypothetical protein
MKGLIMGLGVAIVVAMSAGARAEVYTSESDAELDQLLDKLAQELPYVEPEAEGEMRGEHLDDWCTISRPAAYAVSLQHCSGDYCAWVTYSGTDVHDQGGGYYGVCYGTNFSDVDGLKLSFRTSYSVCDYCADETWTGRYQKSGSGWPIAESNTCGYDASYIKYYVQEVTHYTNYDFADPEYLGKFDYTGAGTDADAWVYTATCPD